MSTISIGVIFMRKTYKLELKDNIEIKYLFTLGDDKQHMVLPKPNVREKYGMCVKINFGKNTYHFSESIVCINNWSNEVEINTGASLLLKEPLDELGIDWF